MNTKNTYNPFFIIGAERSGTTLLRLMLNSHSQVSIPPESLFADELYKQFSDREIKSDDIDEILEVIYLDSKFSDWGISKEDYKQALLKIENINLPRVIAVAYEIYAQNENKVFWGDKNPYYSLKVEELIELFPKAKFIHLKRDGRDNVMSLLNVNWEFGPKNIIEATKRWREYIDASHKAFLKYPKQVIEINYEELIKDTEPNLRTICNFLELEFEQRMLEFYKDDQKKEVPENQHSFQESSFQKPDPSKIGKGKQQLSESELFDFQAISIDTLLENKYEILSLPSRQAADVNDKYEVYKLAQKQIELKLQLEQLQVENRALRVDLVDLKNHLDDRNDFILRTLHNRTSPRWWLKKLLGLHKNDE